MLRQFRRLAALSADERWLLAHAAAMVALVRIARWLLPFRWLCVRLRRASTVSGRLGAMPAGRLAWAVQAAARRVPGANCLTQAVAVQWLLARAGRAALLQIGVAKDAAQGFESHAWVEFEGQFLLEDGEVADRFAPILALRAE